MDKKLNPKQIAFCEAYVKHGNATQAYIEAGYKTTEKVARTNASKLLTNDNIQQYIQKLQKPALKKAEVTVERITSTLAKIAFGELQDVVEIGENGKPKIRPDADLSGIDGLSFSESFDAKGGYSKGFSFKKSDRLKALDMLLKMTGGYDRSPDSDVGNLRDNSGRILEALEKLRGPK
jgi:phage terminase small subunit